jgi:hypothetical protein
MLDECTIGISHLKKNELLELIFVRLAVVEMRDFFYQQHDCERKSLLQNGHKNSSS